MWDEHRGLHQETLGPTSPGQIAVTYTAMHASLELALYQLGPFFFVSPPRSVHVFVSPITRDGLTPLSTDMCVPKNCSTLQ